MGGGKVPREAGRVHNRNMPKRRPALIAAVAGLAVLMLATSPAMAATATIVRKVTTDRKVIALTFDDGWSPTRSARIAAILDQYGATGTFFPYSNAADDAPDVWRSIARRYPIANHTVTHAKLTRLTASQIYTEINRARIVMESITGRPMVRIFRPPYMAYNTTVLEQSYKAGFKIMALWSVDSGDALGVTDSQFYNRAIGGHAGGIVLMHAGPAVTVRNLARVITYYKNHGFTFVTLPKLLGMPWSPATTISGAEVPDIGTVGATCDCTEPEQVWLVSQETYFRQSSYLRAVPD